MNGDNHRAKWDGFPYDSPVVIVAVKQTTHGQEDDFIFQLSSRFHVSRSMANAEAKCVVT